MTKTDHWPWILLLAILLSTPVQAGEALVKKGDIFPEYSFQPPVPAADQKYLGLAEGSLFSIDQARAKYFLIEVVGAYCPVCHEQASQVNHLFRRIRQDPELDGKMLMFSVCPGATETEIQYLKQTWQAGYPILQDEQYEFHKLIGAPDTPYTLVVNSSREILYAHLGRIPEIQEFLTLLKNLAD